MELRILLLCPSQLKVTPVSIKVEGNSVCLSVCLIKTTTAFHLNFHRGQELYGSHCDWSDCWLCITGSWPCVLHQVRLLKDNALHIMQNKWNIIGYVSKLSKYIQCFCHRNRVQCRAINPKGTKQQNVSSGTNNMVKILLFAFLVLLL